MTSRRPSVRVRDQSRNKLNAKWQNRKGIIRFPNIRQDIHQPRKRFPPCLTSRLKKLLAPIESRPKHVATKHK